MIGYSKAKQLVQAQALNRLHVLQTNSYNQGQAMMQVLCDFTLSQSDKKHFMPKLNFKEHFRCYIALSKSSL